MTESSPLTAHFREHKTLFILVGVGLLLIELEIFALAAMKSGRHSWLQVYNGSGHLIYETDGQNLSKFNRYYFEKTFGPLGLYDVRLTSRDRPFPFRAWFTAAVGLPVGAVLLFAFLVQAYQRLFGADHAPGRAKAAVAPPGPDENLLDRIVRQFSSFNVFVLGALVLLAVLAYWIIPNLITDLGRLGLETVLRFKWFFFTAALMGFGLVVWIIYLRYRLACKTIESRAAMDRYRLQLELDRPRDDRLLLGCPPPPEHPSAVLPAADKGEGG